MFRKGLFVTFFLNALYGCQYNTIVENGDLSTVKKVQIIIPEGKDAKMQQTRLYLKDDNDLDNPKMYNYIENDDTIGIFPERGDQIPFIISGLSSPQKNFTFDAESWGLMNNVKYYAYLPFNRSENFSDYNNVTHVYVNYFGQKADKDMCAGGAGNYYGLNYQGKEQSHLYMYSESAMSTAGSTRLNFPMNYLGGFVRIDAFPSTFPPGKSISDTRFILAKLVANHPIFHMEGSYNLKELGDKKTSGNSPEMNDIVPTGRGVSNIVSVVLDSVACDASWGDFEVVFLVPPTNFKNFNGVNDVKINIILYDAEGYYYEPSDGDDQFGSAVFSPWKMTDGICFAMLNLWECKGKAAPEDLIVEPWTPKDETVNANWNYR